METSLQLVANCLLCSTISVTILILVETSLQHNKLVKGHHSNTVTILILVETSLQLKWGLNKKEKALSHNPYFSGNFFATI